MTIAEAVEAIAFDNSQGLTICRNGKSNFLCRGGPFNFENVQELEVFLEKLRARAPREGTRPTTENVPRGTTLLGTGVPATSEGNAS